MPIMAPSHSFFYILSLVWSLTLIPFVLASPWIVTEDYEQVRVTQYEGYYETEDPTVITSVEQIIPTVTPLPEALSTITSIDDYDSYETYTIIQKLYPTSVGTPVPYDYGYYDYYGDDDYHTTIYVVNITYTAPTACSSDWTTTTPVTVYPPRAVMDALPTTAMSTSTSVDNSEPFQPTTHTYDIIWVDPTQLPSSSLSILSEEYYPMTMSDTCGSSSGGSSDGGSSTYGEGCTYSSCRGYYDYDDDDNWWFDSYYMGISPFALVMILTFGWIGIFLILGFIEAWVRFRRLMLGWQTRRGLPILWAFTILPITILVIIGWRKGFQARSAADAVELRKQWDEMGFWTKIKLFFIWGFRYKYPPILGEAPPRVRPSKRPTKQPGSQPQEVLLNTEAPMASGAVGQSVPVERGVGADPEMGEVESNTRPSSGPSSQEQPVTTEASGTLSGHHDGEVGRAQ